MNFELNITLRCNAKCTNCNRLCNLYPERTEDISIERIKNFVDSARAIPGGVGHVKILGGEPLLHPQFKEIFEILYDATKDGTIKLLKLDSNHIIPIPEYAFVPGVRLMNKKFRKKYHAWICNPKDLGITTGAMPSCSMLYRCGKSLDNKGYLPCSQAIGIVRTFGLEHLYKQELPMAPWGLDEICPYCPNSMPRKWINEHTWNISATPDEFKLPSKSYRR